MQSENFIINELLELNNLAAEFFSGKQYHTHHLDHLLRVKKTCLQIGKKLGADDTILEIAALFHDIARAEEDTESCHAELSAEYTSKLLTDRGWDEKIINKICYAIENHRYSSGVIPVSIEAKILQDADRLDALGAIGIIRVSQFNPLLPYYQIDEPFPDNRAISKDYTLDHYYEKILKLIDGFHTKEALEMAKPRQEFLLKFLEQLKKEIGK